MNRLKKIFHYYNWGGRFLNDPVNTRVAELNRQEELKKPKRYDIINHLLNHLNRETNYLEIGVRNPDDNFNKINATNKVSVDPGLEFKENPVDFKLTSDAFFEQLNKGEILPENNKFDVIFIDGLHLAEQVYRDILNALDFIKDDGFIVLHDCNPPTEWHAREMHSYDLSPARNNWNGTTWKAFVKTKEIEGLSRCCVDTDWGVGILSKKKYFKNSANTKNEFYEFDIFQKHKTEFLNLISYKDFKTIFT